MGPVKRPAKLDTVQDEDEDGNDDYKKKRNKNNEAVQKSRQKAREKAMETTCRVQKLKNENEKLEERIKLLSNKLTFLKDIFLTHVGE